MTLITKKCTLWPYLAIYMQFSRHALFTKTMPTNLLIRHDFNCHINEREAPTTCLTNHKSSISHHITPLVINSLGGKRTHTQTYSHCGQKQFQETSCGPARVWFKNIFTCIAEIGDIHSWWKGISDCSGQNFWKLTQLHGWLINLLMCF